MCEVINRAGLERVISMGNSQQSLLGAYRSSGFAEASQNGRNLPILWVVLLGVPVIWGAGSIEGAC